MEPEQLKQYEADGCIFPVRGLFRPERLEEIDRLLSTLVAERPQVEKGDEQTLAPEDLLNLHLTCKEVWELCREPSVLEVAAQILGCQDVSVFTSRILCKEPGTGKEIVWHQDSNYWPLTDPFDAGTLTPAPRVTSLWLALDEVTRENGAMEVLPFSAQPESRRNLPQEFILDSGGSTKAFDNFNLSLDSSKLNVAQKRPVLLQRGEAEFHSAYTIHRSEPNRSERRRLAWIVRYCPTGSQVVPGIRDSFDEDYPLVPVLGRGAVEAPAGALRLEGAEGAAAFPGLAAREIYLPCFGNAVKELKK
ncbi:unnamed protein product [Durusdinium trenchii]|uniref:Phytanoyl-CoA dioxygenase family protein n=1 Tax=Durusdinium trenchii TaxID=1381693 RepID=A0ABP0PX16_9DINO